MNSKVLAWVLLLLSILGTNQVITYRSNNLSPPHVIDDLPSLVTLPPKVISVLFLGNERIYQHYLNLWLLQALADKPSTPTAMINLIRKVLVHAPPIPTLYLISCFTMYQTYQAPEYCEEITQAGLKALPDDFRLLVTQGYISAVVTNEPEKAAVYYFMAAQNPRAPKYILNVAEKLAQNREANHEDLLSLFETIIGTKNKPKLREFINRIKHHKEP